MTTANFQLSSPRNIGLRLRIFIFFRLLRPTHTGWNLIRLGSSGDGGYLVPNDIDGMTQLFSPGVSDQTGFDLEMAARGISCFLADPVLPKSLPTHPRIQFKQLALGDGQNGTITLKHWGEQNRLESGNAILQMDIEGAEWQVLRSAGEYIRHFRIMIIELHDIHHLVSGWRQFLRALIPILHIRMAFDVVHAHQNNVPPTANLQGHIVPKVIEITLHRRSRRREKPSAACLPNSLDRPNDPGRPNHPLPAHWT